MKRMLIERELEVVIYVVKGYIDVEIFKKIYVIFWRILMIINYIKEKWYINFRVELGILVYYYGFIDVFLFLNKKI